MSADAKHTDKVWVVDDDRSIRWVLERALVKAGLDSQSFESASSVLSQLEHDAPEVIISDIRMPGMGGLELLERMQRERPAVPVIIMTAHSDLDAAVASYRGGAFEYLPKPFDIDDAIAVVKRAIAHAAEMRGREVPEPEATPTEIIGQAPAMQEVFRAIGRLAHSHISVLIQGESGTGKELVAHALHRHSPRAKADFVALNMAAIPKDLIESELFGHEKGAFTGATSQRVGRFEQAHGGTLFLDEIGDMPAEAQTRLLRVLAEGEFYRVGGQSPVKVDVRIIAATHQDLEKLVTNGRFREDLFHRLNVIRVHLPKLADRREDIPLLARHFMRRASEELGERLKALTPEAEAFMLGLPWPGNVRQLENVCRWLTVMAPGREILIEDLPAELKRASPSPAIGWEPALRHWADAELALLPGNGAAPLLDQAMPRFERIMIEAALARTGGRKRDAAVLLGWGRNTLTRKIKELGMQGSVVDSGDDDSDD